jgi:catechol-2,3-dioxygenase
MKDNRFNSDRIGLNHLAFGLKKKTELKEMAKLLSRLKITHSGIKTDKHGKKEYIWLNDPDDIRIEFYLRN